MSFAKKFYWDRVGCRRRRTCCLGKTRSSVSAVKYFFARILSRARVIPDNEDCPAYLREGSDCFQNCKCWLPKDRYATEQNRTNIRRQGEMWLLHRLSYFLFNGPLETLESQTMGVPVQVLHRCDCSPCYNPEHLSLGDSTDNNRQKHENGRHVHHPKEVADHNLRDAYDYPGLLKLVKERCTITAKNEWLYNFSKGRSGYPTLMVNYTLFVLSRLILANKLGKKYEEIVIACHLLPDGSEGQKYDLNPDHLVDGTRKDNGNHSFMNKSPLNAKDVSYIRDSVSKLILKRGDASKFDELMSKKFNVSVNTINNIRLGNSHGVYHDGTSVKTNLEKPVIQYDLQGNVVREYASVAEAMRLNDYKSNNVIYDVCNGVNGSVTYKGFVWKYKKV